MRAFHRRGRSRRPVLDTSRGETPKILPGRALVPGTPETDPDSLPRRSRAARAEGMSARPEIAMRR
jgi:hypothetical protein